MVRTPFQGFRHRFWVPPAPSLLAGRAPTVTMPEVLALPQSRRVAAALPVQVLPPTAAVRAEGLRGEALQLLLHLLLSGPAEVVAAVATPNGHHPPATHLLLLLPRLVAVVGVGAVVAEVVAVVGAMVVEAAEATTPA